MLMVEITLKSLKTSTRYQKYDFESRTKRSNKRYISVKKLTEIFKPNFNISNSRGHLLIK